MFSGCTVTADSNNTKLGISDQQSSPSAGENGSVLTAISSGVDISDVPGSHLLQQVSSQWGSQKLLQGLVPHELILNQRIMDILSKGCKQDNFESYNSLKSTSTNN